MLSSLSSYRPTSPAAQVDSAQSSSSQVGKSGELKPSDSKNVFLSQAALKLLAESQKAAEANKSDRKSLDDMRKDRARERMAQIKEQIKQLKSSLLSMMGAPVSKTLLNLLKQLSQELKQVAGVLNEGGGGDIVLGQMIAPAAAAPSVPAQEAAGQPASGADAGEARAAYAATQAMAQEPSSGAEDQAHSGQAPVQGSRATAASESDSATNGKPLPIEISGLDSDRQSKAEQRKGDARELDKLSHALRALLLMAKSIQKAEEKHDKAMQKQLKDIDKLLDDTDKTSTELALSAVGVSVGGVNAKPID